jgi:diadenosine tetraphosphate (Ap4A) HIT family hydrolase
MKTSHTVVRVPDNDWNNLMETVTLDGSYSEQIKNEVWTAMENIRDYSYPWVVVKISEGKSSAKIFRDKEDAQKYFLKEKKKLKRDEQIFYMRGYYR